MDKNNLPNIWCVKNDGSKLFQDTVIKYLNDVDMYDEWMQGGMDNYFYGMSDLRCKTNGVSNGNTLGEYSDTSKIFNNVVLTLSEFIKLTMTKEDKLIEIYQDTKNICLSIPEPLTYKIYNTDNEILHAGIDIEIPERKGNIIVENLDTVSALVKYAPQGRTAILNMAFYKRPGGGVEHGAVAQEECLFRCSNLFTISKDLYPLKDNEYIYTKDVTFIKDFHYNVMPHVLVDVITMPAINLNERKIKDFKLSTDDECYYLDNIFFMLNSALINGCNNIILGAWGSGVFKNDPKIMAELFKEILEGGLLYTMFDNIVFAVINDANSVDNNYEVYKKVFKC